MQMPHAAPLDAEEAARLLELAEADPLVASALADAYEGRFPVLDALWWRAHPLVTAPSGSTDPAVRRARLQAGAFSRAGADAPGVEVTDAVTGEVVVMTARAAELLELERRLAADAAALDDAVQDARPAVAEAERRAAERAEAEPAYSDSADPDSADGASADAEPADAGSADAESSASHRLPRRTAASWRKRSQVWMWTAIAFGVVLLGGVGLIVVQHVAPGAAGGFALLPAAAGSSIPTPQPTLTGSEGLTIFEDPTRAPAIVPANIDPYYKPDSLRLLGVADSNLTVYAVENRLDQPCLLAVYTDSTQSATCVTKDEFTSMGIELRLTSLQVTRVNDSDARAISQDVVFWNPDGSYGVSSSPTTSTAASGSGG